MKQMAIVCGFILCVAALVTQPGDAAAESAVEEIPKKEPAIALGLGVGVTTLGVVVIAASLDTSEPYTAFWISNQLLAMGPSAGYAYSQAYNRGLVVLAVQTTGLAMFWLSLDQLENDSESAATAITFVAGGALVLGTTVFGIIDSALSVSRWNKRQRQRQLGLTPTALVGPDRTTGLGLALGGAF